MSVRVLLLALVVIVSAPPVAGALPQQKEDLYSVPAKAKYSPAKLAGKRPLTRPERTNYAETSLYTDVVMFIDSLKLLGAKIETGSLGKTNEGRDLLYVIASKPLITTPAEARRLGRPVAYIQANIHSGEVEGKEAMLAMLRDLLFDTRPNVLDSIVLIVQPNYNADGNEKLAENRLGSQNGPRMTGTRPTGQGWNLNRDYVGADAPETRASLAMLNRWNPDLFMDLHTTNGSLHGYSLTYAPTLTPAAVTVGPYLQKTMIPEIRNRVRARQGFEIFDYGSFGRVAAPGAARGAPGGRGADTAGRGAARGAAGGGRGADSAARGAARGQGRGGGSLETIVADSIPTGGWAFRTYEPLPRYGSNYYGLRGRLSILSEAFSHDPFPRRIASTYAFVGEILSFVAEKKNEIFALTKKADEDVAAWARNPASSPQIGLRSRMDTTRIEAVRVETIIPNTDTTRRELGVGRGQQRTGIIKLVTMPVMASFTPTLTRTLPFAYAFDAAAADSLLPILKIHGVTVERLNAAANVTAQGFMVENVVDRPPNETPRRLKTVNGTWGASAARSLPAGTYIVRAGQQFGLLAFHLLEPESEDGLQSFVSHLTAVQKEFPAVRITANANLNTTPVR
jgi:hypothetical protein